MKHIILSIATILSLSLVGCRTGNEIEDTQCKKHREVTLSHISGAYYGRENSESYNYYIVLSASEISDAQVEANTTYYYFDIYSDEMSLGTHYVQLPEGKYHYDADNGQLANHFCGEYSYALVVDSEGYTSELRYTSGELTITHNSIEALLVMEDGTTHHLHYSGNTLFRDLANEPLSTLTDDVELHISGATIDVEDLSVLGTGYSHYYIMLYEDSARKEGTLVIMELLTTRTYSYLPDDDSYYNTYHVFDYIDGDYYYRFLPGQIDNVTMRGAWYMTLEDGLPTTTVAPIINGTIAVGLEDGECFKLDCYDDAGNHIWGEIRE